MQRHASEMKSVTFTSLNCYFITFCCFILFYFIPYHVLSKMMFKCTLMKEQINFFKSKSNQIKLFLISFDVTRFKCCVGICLQGGPFPYFDEVFSL